MINKILLKDFKGITAEQELDKLNIFCGLNGVGKTARSQAISLAVLGYIPEHGDKQPAKIYKTHGCGGKPFSVGIELDDVTFSRTFHPDRQDIFYKGRKIKKADESKVVAELGVKVFDLSAFNGLSDSKKIEYLFDLFPPVGDLSVLDIKITDKKNEINKIGDQLRGNKSAVKTMVTEQANIEVPAGTLAEITAEIGGKEKSLADMREGLEKENLRLQKLKDEEAADLKLQQQKEESEVDKDKAVEKISEEQKAGVTSAGSDSFHPFHQGQEGLTLDKPREIPPTIHHQILNDLAAIKMTMESAGCSECAAMLVLKQMIGKYRKAVK